MRSKLATQQVGGTSAEMSARLHPNDTPFNTISTATSISSFREIVRAQERAPLLNRDDVEAGPAQSYGASTPAEDAASTTGETFCLLPCLYFATNLASQYSEEASGQKYVTPSSQGESDIMSLQLHGSPTTHSLCKSLSLSL